MKKMRKMTNEEIGYLFGEDVELTPADTTYDESVWSDDVDMAFVDAASDDMSPEAMEVDLAAATLDTIVYVRDPKQLTEMFNALRDPDKDKADLAGRQVYEQLHKWILSIGYKHFPTWMRNQQEQGELVSEAWEAVLRAIPKYDPSQSAPSTYFYRPILHNMSEYINKFLKKSTGYNSAIQRQIKEARRSLAAAGIRNPSVLDIAYEAGLRASIVRKSIEFTGATETRSLDEMSVDPSEYSATGRSARARDDYDMSATAYSEQYNPYARLVQQENKAALDAALADLPPMQREVLCRMYGIGCNKQTIAEVGKAMNLPTNQVKDLEARAKSRLKVDGRLRATWKGVGTQVKEAFGFESLSITPDKVGLSMMDTLAEIEALS